MIPPARFPRIPAAAGHYESFYVKACHPRGGLGAWIRYTVHKRPGEPAKGFLWFTLFDAESGVVAAKAEGKPTVGERDLIRIGDARFGLGYLNGQAAAPLLEATWDLRFEGGEPPLFHLPQGWMYSAPIPRTKVLSPHPHVLVSGEIDAGGRLIALDGWLGMVGHNWGSEHAKRAIWLQGTGFAQHPDAWLDVAIARVALGPVTTPWLGGGALCLDGRRHRLLGLRHASATSIEETPERCRFRLAGDGVTVLGEVGAPRERFVSWIYAQPRGGEHQTVNCSIADMRLEVSRRGAPTVVLEASRRAAYELQMEERYPAIPVQPFEDG